MKNQWDINQYEFKTDYLTMYKPIISCTNLLQR